MISLSFLYRVVSLERQKKSHPSKDAVVSRPASRIFSAWALNASGSLVWVAKASRKTYFSFLKVTFSIVGGILERARPTKWSMKLWLH
jgi:hypothetical protein